MLKIMIKLAIVAAVVGSLLGYFGGDTAAEALAVNTWLPWQDDVLRYFETTARAFGSAPS